MNNLFLWVFSLAMAVGITGIAVRLVRLEAKLKVREEINQLYAENAATLSKLIDEQWKTAVKRGKRGR